MSERADTAGAAPPVPPPEMEEPRSIGVTRSAKRRADARAGIVLISPTFVIVLVMVVLPILWTISMAFQQIRLLNLRSAGIFGDYTLENFEGIFTSSGFWTALRTTLIYSVLGTAFAIGLGLIAALALRRPFRGRTLIPPRCSCRTSLLSSRPRSPGARCSTRSSAS